MRSRRRTLKDTRCADDRLVDVPHADERHERHHLLVLHEQVVIMSIETVPVPHVSHADRIEVDDLGYAGDGIIHATARFGYMETPDVPAALRLLDPAQTEGPISVDEASFFLSKIELKRGRAPTMAPWRKQLFLATSHITADAAAH